MWNGTSALKNIDQTLLTIRNDVVRLDSQLSQLTNTVGESHRHRVQIINKIAKIRLDAIDNGDLITSLNAADIDALKILEQRDIEVQKLNANIEKINSEIAELELIRESLLGEVNVVSQKIVEIEGVIQNELSIDQSYKSQFDKASLAESVAEEASQKVTRAQSDMASKAKPYQDDDLFIYLWKRGYGTTEYRAGLFSRFLDGWVARLIKYESSRINYWNLVEIPKRLQEHSDAVDNLADEERMTLQQIEFDALEKAGRSKLEQELDLLRNQLDAKDDELESKEDLLKLELDKRSGFTSGNDNFMSECIQRLTQALDHHDLTSIHRYVRDTHSPTDDKLVIELQRIDNHLENIQEDLNDIRLLHVKKVDKLKDLESVRRNFKNSRFDDVRSGFGNEELIVNVIGEFLKGVISGSDLWKVIKRNQRYQDVNSSPEFGSGGLGNLGDILGGGSIGRRNRRKRKSSWHLPKPRRGGGGFSIPGSSSRGGGGFKTGGSF